MTSLKRWIGIPDNPGNRKRPNYHMNNVIKWKCLRWICLAPRLSLQNGARKIWVAESSQTSSFFFFHVAATGFYLAQSFSIARNNDMCKYLAKYYKMSIGIEL